MNARKAVAVVGLAVAVSLGASGCERTQGTSGSKILLYTEEDLSGPVYTEPMTDFRYDYSAGAVCYATPSGNVQFVAPDGSLYGVDAGQLYVNCNDVKERGGVIGREGGDTKVRVQTL